MSLCLEGALGGGDVKDSVKTYGLSLGIGEGPCQAKEVGESGRSGFSCWTKADPLVHS